MPKGNSIHHVPGSMETTSDNMEKGSKNEERGRNNTNPGMELPVEMKAITSRVSSSRFMQGFPIYSPDQAHERLYHGINITFQDVSIKVGRCRKAKTILNKVTGYSLSASLTALMGPSGSGKTTLVDVLTKTKNAGVLEGVVLYDGEKPKPEFLKYCVSYVQQDDALIENFSVKEALHYNYDLIMGKASSREDKNKAVDLVIRQLALEEAKDTLIGNSLRKGISGGQKKRVSIGISLLSRPSVLVMDEPTSGLDSYTSFEVMSTVKELCKRGLTTITTIHAPSPSIFSMFDTLMILLKGRVVYFGDAVERSVVYFCDELGFDRPGHRNIADWLTSIVVETSRMNGSDTLVLKYDESLLKEENITRLEDLKNAVCRGRAQQHLLVRQQKHSWQKKIGAWPIYILLKHRMIADYREPSFLIPRVGEKVLFAFVILTLYLNVGREETGNAQDRIARLLNLSTALFMWGVLPAFGSLAVIPALYSERDLFSREQKAGYYESFAYLFARMTEEGAITLLLSAVLACAVWFAIMLRGSWALFWLVYFVTGLVGIVMAYMFSALSPTPEFAIILCAGVNIVLLFFTGFLIRMINIPVYWKWIVYINYLHFAWGALMKNQFQQADIFGNQPILEYYSLDDSKSSWDYLGYQMIFLVFFFIAGSLSFKYVSYSRR